MDLKNKTPMYFESFVGCLISGRPSELMGRLVAFEKALIRLQHRQIEMVIDGLWQLCINLLVARLFDAGLASLLILSVVGLSPKC